jgi:hypothetical protein
MQFNLITQLFRTKKYAHTCPQSADQIEEDRASDIAWLHGYDTLVYEFMPQGNQLQIVLIEGDYREDNNYTENNERMIRVNGKQNFKMQYLWPLFQFKKRAKRAY